MKRNHPLTGSAVRRASWTTLLLAALGTLSAQAANATTITWTNAAGGAWSNASNWSPANVPDSPGETAVLPALSGAYTVTLDMNPAADAISIAAGDPTLDLNGSSIASVGLIDNYGTLANFVGTYSSVKIKNRTGGTVTVPSGTFEIAAGDTVENDGTLLIGGTFYSAGIVSIGGTGTVRFDDASIVDASGLPQTGGWIKILAGQTLTGSGLCMKRIWNYGTWIADDNDDYLQVRALTYNRGTILIKDGGRLRIESALGSGEGGVIATGEGGGVLDMTYTNGFGTMGTVDLLRGGKIEMNGGDLEIFCHQLVGGPIESVGGGDVLTLSIGTLQQMSIEAGAEVLVTQNIDFLRSNETVIIDGTLRVRSAMIHFGLLNTADSIYVQGTGSIELEDGTLGSGDGGYLVCQPGFTIHGTGTINPPFVNYGTVDLEGGSMIADNPRLWLNAGLLRVKGGGLTVRGANTVLRNIGRIESTALLTIDKGGVVDNRAGAIVAGRYGVKIGTTSTPGTLWGGTLEGRDGGEFLVNRGGTLKDVKIAESGVLRVAPNATALLTGKFQNLGTVKIGGRIALDGMTPYLQNAGATVMEGGMLQSGRDVQLQGGRLRGHGTIAANLSNRGIVSPDAGANALRVTGNYTQYPGASLEFTLAGTANDQMSHFDVAGNAALAGSLTPVLAAGYAPASGLAFPVFRYGSMSGAFDPLALAGGASAPFMPYFADGSMSLITGGTTAVGGSPVATGTLRFFGANTREGTSFVLELPYAAELKGRLYDASGREVARLADGAMPAGVHSFRLNRSGGVEGLASGVYFARMSIAGGGLNEVRNARAIVVR